MVTKMFRPLCFTLCWAFIYTVDGYRLPTSVIPSYYKLQIMSYIGEPDNFNFEGKVYIQVNCLEPTKNITLHSTELNITNDEVRIKDISSSNSQPIKVENIQMDTENDFLIINLREELRKEHNYEIFIPYRAVLADGLKGFYRSSYSDGKTKEKKWMGVTQFEAISARRAFPCFDEPAMKARFEIILGRKNTLSSISNMPLATTEPNEEKEGWVWDKYEPSVPMSTYLVAFIVSDFEYKISEPSKYNNVTFRTWAKKDSLDQVDYAKEVGPKVLDYFEQFFDIQYPLPKQDMVAIPDFSAGAMENWGLITYRESVLLFDPKISSFSSQHRIANVIAHELAHQWFGNLVTMKWWTDLWLNEGFATYMASQAVDYLYPHWKSLEQDVVSNILNVFSFDSLRTSHPVSVPIGHPNQIDEIFDTIAYKKGSFLIRMMSLFLGEETLKRGVSNYLKAHKYKNAEQDDLWESLTEEAHKNNVLPQNLTVKTVMDTWTLQTGYPVVTVTRDYEKKTVRVTQQRFLRDEIREKSDKGCWWIPLTYTNGNELDFESVKPRAWLSCTVNGTHLENMPDEKTWILFNIRLGGLYKINYDEQNWNLLIQTLNSDNHKDISILNKVQLLDDSYDLAWTGNLKYDIYFNVLQYLEREEEYLPWQSALANIKSLNRQLKRSAIFGVFKNYMRKLLTSIYEKLGNLEISTKKSDKLDAVKHQILISSWACRFDVANCVADAQELFKKYQKTPEDKNIISKELKSVIYCTAVKHGTEKEWNFLWEQYRKSPLASEKQTILDALGCTREMWLLRRYLEWSITSDSGVRKQDSATVFGAVAANDVGFYSAKHFLKTKFKDIHSYLSPNGRRLSRYLSSIATQVTTEDDYKELQNMIKGNSMYLKEVKQGVEQSLEMAKLNVQWQHRHSHDIEVLLGKLTDEKSSI